MLRSINIFTNDDGDLEPIQIDEYSDKLINREIAYLGTSTVNTNTTDLISSIIRIGLDTFNVSYDGKYMISVVVY